MEPLIEYTNLSASDIKGRSRRIDGCLYMITIRGRAVLDVDADRYIMTEQCEFDTQAPCLINCKEVSDDFQARMYVYPQSLIEGAKRSIDSKWFEWNAEHPFYKHTPDVRSQRTWRETVQWMDLAETLFSADSKILFPELQQQNFITGMWMWHFGTIQDKIGTASPNTRSHEIYRRFIHKVNEHGIGRHTVTEYANMLNITPRYLNNVVARHSLGRTAKQIIDQRLTLHIKELLASTSLSVSEIALQLGFNDQSALSRHFFRSTGIYPSAYRHKIDSQQ